MWVPSSSAALAVGQVAMETLKLEVFHALERLSIRSMHLGSLMKTDTCHFSSNRHHYICLKYVHGKKSPRLSLAVYFKRIPLCGFDREDFFSLLH